MGVESCDWKKLAGGVNFLALLFAIARDFTQIFRFLAWQLEPFFMTSLVEINVCEDGFSFEYFEL